MLKKFKSRMCLSRQSPWSFGTKTNTKKQIPIFECVYLLPSTDVNMNRLMSISLYSSNLQGGPQFLFHRKLLLLTFFSSGFIFILRSAQTNGKLHAVSRFKSISLMARLRIAIKIRKTKDGIHSSFLFQDCLK